MNIRESGHLILIRPQIAFYPFLDTPVWNAVAGEEVSKMVVPPNQYSTFESGYPFGLNPINCEATIQGKLPSP